MIFDARKTAPPTDEDFEINHSLAYLRQGAGRGVHAYYRTMIADATDADIMNRLARTRRNNKRARAYPEQPGELAP